jgi:hypothetical protein
MPVAHKQSARQVRHLVHLENLFSNCYSKGLADQAYCKKSEIEVLDIWATKILFYKLCYIVSTIVIKQNPF